MQYQSRSSKIPSHKSLMHSQVCKIPLPLTPKPRPKCFNLGFKYQELRPEQNSEENYRTSTSWSFSVKTAVPITTPSINCRQEAQVTPLLCRVYNQLLLLRKARPDHPVSLSSSATENWPPQKLLWHCASPGIPSFWTLQSILTSFSCKTYSKIKGRRTNL